METLVGRKFKYTPFGCAFSMYLTVSFVLFERGQCKVISTDLVKFSLTEIELL